MLKGVFNPHFLKNYFFVVQHDQLNESIIEMSISDKQNVLHYMNDFINYSLVKEDYILDISRFQHNIFPRT